MEQSANSVYESMQHTRIGLLQAHKKKEKNNQLNYFVIIFDPSLAYDLFILQFW